MDQQLFKEIRTVKNTISKDIKEENLMYMLSYKGTKSRTFGTHLNIEDCKADAISHAAENARIKGEYIITKVKEIGNTGLVSADLTQKPYKGIKHGKSIEWMD